MNALFIINRELGWRLWCIVERMGGGRNLCFDNIMMVWVEEADLN